MIVTDLTFIEETVSYPWDWSVFKTQMEEQPQISQVFRNRRHLTRRPNACIPCRKSKLRCDGKLPRCSACTKKRHKSDVNLCVYPKPVPKRRAINAESEDEAERATPSEHDSTSDDGLEQPPHRGPPCVVEDDELFGPYSIAHCIDQFKSLPANKDSILSFSSISQCSAREAFQTPANSSGAITSLEESSAAPQLMLPLCPFSLSDALAESMAPYLRHLYNEAIRVQGLIRIGNLMKAWVDMPTLVRLAQLARFDHVQGSKTPPPETPETELRLRVWWFILDLDVQISMHIGKPLAVRVKLGIDRPTLDGIDGVYKNLEQSRLDFKRYALEVLGDICVYDDQDGSQTYETLLEVMKLDQLRDLEKRLPQTPQDDEFDEQLFVAICDHKIELFAMKMMLFCSLAKAGHHKQDDSSKSVLSKDLQGKFNANPKKPARARPPNREIGNLDQVPILEAARSILGAFKMVAKLENYDRYSNWNRLLDVYCAVAVLGIDALRKTKQRSVDHELISWVSHMLNMISTQNPRSQLATIAARRIRDLFAQIQRIHEQEGKARRQADYVSKPKRVRTKETSNEKAADDISPKKRKSGEVEPAQHREVKRRRGSPASANEEYQTIDNPYTNPLHGMSHQQDMSASQASQLAPHGEEYFPEPLGMGNEVLPNTFEGGSTSFDNGMNMTQYSPYWGLTDPNYTNTGVPYGWYHPPLAHPLVPMRDFDEWGPPQSAVDSSHMHQTISPFQNTMDPQQMAHFDQSAGMGSGNEQNYYNTQNMAAMSVPNTPHPSSANRHFRSAQQSAPQEREGDMMTNQTPRPTEEKNAWEWVQRQRAIAGQVTAAPETAGYPYYSTFEIPPVSSAWS